MPHCLVAHDGEQCWRDQEPHHREKRADDDHDQQQYRQHEGETRIGDKDYSRVAQGGPQPLILLLQQQRQRVHLRDQPQERHCQPGRAHQKAQRGVEIERSIARRVEPEIGAHDDEHQNIEQRQSPRFPEIESQARKVVTPTNDLTLSHPVGDIPQPGQRRRQCDYRDHQQHSDDVHQY